MEGLSFFIIIFSIGAIAFLGLWFLVFKPTSLFYDKCDELETDIKEKDNQNHQIHRLIELNKDSWHRTTDERITQLAKMLEVKYNVVLIKD